jgi:hypothetical protein
MKIYTNPDKAFPQQSYLELSCLKETGNMVMKFAISRERKNHNKPTIPPIVESNNKTDM